MTLSIFPSKSAERLRTGDVVTGVIRRFNYRKKTYSVSVDRPKATLKNCHWAEDTILGLIGARHGSMPTPGTRVVVLVSKPNFIIKTLPNDMPDAKGGKVQSITGQLDFLKELNIEDTDEGSNDRRPLPADLLPGEESWSLPTGPAMQLLYTMARLQGSSRAAVETHLLDDLVRIICERYEHLSSLGKLEVINDGGGPSVVFKAASLTHEARGNLDVSEPEAEVSNNKVDAESLADILRHRFVSYMGYLGDFLNLIVCDPDDTVKGYLAQQNSGKFRAHTGQDGTLLLQSTAEIILERTVTIPIPIQNHELDDPEGDTRQMIEQAVRKGGERLDTMLQRWEWGKRNERMHLLPYQLREYARYISQLHSWGRLLGRENDFTMLSESETDQPTWDNGQDDVIRANKARDSASYLNTYSTIRMMRDGSIMLMDGWNSSIIMSTGDVRFSALRDLDCEAGRDIRMTAGRNFYAMARRHMELGAMVGQMSLRGRTGIQALAEWGPIWLKSDAPDINDPAYGDKAKTKDDQPDPELDPAPEKHEFGIILDVPQSSVLALSGRRVRLETTGNALADSEIDNVKNSMGSIELVAKKQDIHLSSARNSSWTTVTSSRDDAAVGNLMLRAEGFVVQANDTASIRATNMLELNRQVVIRKEDTCISRLVVGSCVGTLYGPKAGPTDVQGVVGSHFNHVLKKEDYSGDPSLRLVQGDEGARSQAALKSKLDIKAGFKKVTEPVWNYHKPVEYLPAIRSGLDKNANPFRSPAQERLTEDTAFDSGYGDWNWSDNRLNTGAVRTGTQYGDPWYGAAAKWRVSTSSEEPLHLLSSRSGEELLEQSDITDSPRVMRYWRKST